MHNLRFTTKALAVASALVMFSAVVLAHHSAAQYSRDIMTTRGTVDQYIWRNPHVTLIWSVKGANGEITDVKISYPCDLTLQMLEYSEL